MKVQICGECNHNADSHNAARDLSGWGGKPRVGPCSMGGCACARTKQEVIDTEPKVDRVTVPGFDHQTNTWKPR